MYPQAKTKQNKKDTHYISYHIIVENWVLKCFTFHKYAERGMIMAI